jgi:(S)-2-hydroxyglutarate dehydrogenase
VKRQGRRRVLVVGGGIVGLATAWKLLRERIATTVVVLEKEPGVGRHQSGHNSGVLHAGLYYRPGSEKARLAVAGIREMTSFCEEHGVAHEQCGKLVVASAERDLPRLDALLRRGEENGLRGLERLGPEAMREVEPHVAGLGALRVPEEGIVDFPAVCGVLAALVRGGGGEVITSAGLLRLERRGASWLARSAAGDHEADFVVGCAGLHADRVARMAGAEPGLRIVPFRGEYFLLRPRARHLVRHLVYPVPDPALPFLGVHFTRRVSGEVEAGPNAVLALAREGYRRGSLDARDALEMLLFPGLWRFFGRFPGPTWMEARRSWLKPLFVRSLQRLVPEVRGSDLAPGGAGVRAQAMRPDGSLVEDFAFVETPGSLHVLNAPSPAATASLAIGGEIARRIGSRLQG